MSLCDLANSGCNCISLPWVLGHTGIQGNEIADVLVREGLGIPFVDTEPSIGISKGLFSWCCFSSDEEAEIFETAGL